MRIHKMLFMALLLSVFMAGCGDDDNNGGGAGPGPAGASPDIGSASTYGIFASDAAVTLAADTLVDGDVGLNPAGACNNCTVTTVTGTIHNGDAEAIQAQSDFGDAYLDASTRTTNACTIADGELSSAQGDCSGFTPGPVYRAGLYRTANPIGIGDTFTITLDARGNPNAVFIFQTDAAITTGSNSTVVLANGAKAKNVWWIAGSAATLGVSSIFKGTVIANGAAVSVLGGTITEPTLVTGRLFSSSAAADLGQYATVTVPQ
ncbi:MAG TPA: ice-binding family protein [Nitrospiria bacterium]